MAWLGGSRHGMAYRLPLRYKWHIVCRHDMARRLLPWRGSDAVGMAWRLSTAWCIGCRHGMANAVAMAWLGGCRHGSEVVGMAWRLSPWHGV